jgi:hypothetical protein
MNQLNPQSRKTLVDWVMTESSESLKIFFADGARAMLDQGGPTYRIEADGDAGVSTEIMRELVESIANATSVSIVIESSTVIASVRFPGSIEQLTSTVTEKLSESYEAAQLDTPAIDSLKRKVLIH